MVWAGEAFAVAAAGRDDDCAAVTAGIDKSLQRKIFIAHDQHRHAGHFGALEISRYFQLTTHGQHQRQSLENFRHFQLPAIRVVVMLRGHPQNIGHLLDGAFFDQIDVVPGHGNQLCSTLVIRHHGHLRAS